ncbi:MAG: acyl-CoA dehydrogenase [Rhodospirillaceae bacterium]|jgi:alkylation response protein AidB-like acyl-CoA dehydrogenase|nr:acyl-CoA dehydrogenase [Rhodospirillaceae bacterium]MBT7488014.1 acyl-CoA dehydrogenase [Rhodospirillales bacterium]MBT5033899.1 acyl-CoA dehydrogenase [Rhodospirillaceae bacterium]MBT6220441.1 acyl-CoA dehydrogenase [Rhodospirillaceae bacterium]MBT6361652.1 acyl-CoA dehydrogenase [Rhodospirillaceae bacterium]
MDFNLNEDQKLFKDSVEGFAQHHLADGAVARAHEDTYPWEVAKLMAEQGLLGITINEADGGQGGSLMDAVLAIEAIAKFCPRSADVVQAGNFGAIRVLAEYASSEQKERLLGPMLKGEKLIAVAMTEPEAGSAATDLKTTATPDGDGFRINGSKIFTTHGQFADVFLAYVRYGPGVGGIGSVLIERGQDGFKTGNPVKFMSGEEWVQLYFDDAYVGPENVLLGEGGFKKQIAGFNVERIGNTARSLALGRYAFEIARDYAATREQFGRTLNEFQGLQWKFAEMKVKLDAAELLLYRAACNSDGGFPSAEETSIAKLYCNTAGFEVANEAMQIMGGAGFSEDCLIEYCVRRTRGWMIAGGSLEMMKNRIAESVFERRFSQRPPRPETK